MENWPEGAEEELFCASRLLRDGGVVAIPTDTLYGLAADAFSARAIERVFAIKERPEGMALPVLLAGLDQLTAVVPDVPPDAVRLAEAFWPGPLTLVLPRADMLPPRLTAGSPTVAVRVPAHPVPRRVGAAFGAANHRHQRQYQRLARPAVSQRASQSGRRAGGLRGKPRPSSRWYCVHHRRLDWRLSEAPEGRRNFVSRHCGASGQPLDW